MASPVSVSWRWGWSRRTTASSCGLRSPARMTGSRWCCATVGPGCGTTWCTCGAAGSGPSCHSLGPARLWTLRGSRRAVLAQPVARGPRRHPPTSGHRTLDRRRTLLGCVPCASRCPLESGGRRRLALPVGHRTRPNVARGVQGGTRRAIDASAARSVRSARLDGEPHSGRGDRVAHAAVGSRFRRPESRDRARINRRQRSLGGEPRVQRGHQRRVQDLGLRCDPHTVRVTRHPSASRPWCTGPASAVRDRSSRHRASRRRGHGHRPRRPRPMAGAPRGGCCRAPGMAQRHVLTPSPPSRSAVSGHVARGRHHALWSAHSEPLPAALNRDLHQPRVSVVGRPVMAVRRAGQLAQVWQRG